MQKLLLILICLFVSFEVKSRLSQKLMKNSEKVNVKDCLKYFNKGKILNSHTNTSRGNIEKFKRYGEYYESKIIQFSYEGKFYHLFLSYKSQSRSDNIGEDINKTLEQVGCYKVNFEKTE